MAQQGLARLLRPPRLRPADDGASERHATWFELFFDLVFVLAITQLSHMLQSSLTLTQGSHFLGLFVPVWWAWVIYTFYADRFDTDDVVYRLLIMAGMLAITALATTLHNAYDAGAQAFVLCYLFVRAVPLLLYIRAGRYVPIGQRLARSYGTGSLIAAVFWIAGLFVPSVRYICWALAVLVELMTPLVAWRNVANTPMNVSHIVERFGLFTIIVLGELVVSVGSSLAQTEWRPAIIAMAAGVFIVACCIWWFYFDFSAMPEVQRTFLTSQVYVFGHLPIVMGLTMVAAGSVLAIKQAEATTLSSDAAWLLCGGVALCMFTHLLVRLVLTPTPLNVARVVSAIISTLVLLLPLLHNALSPALFIGLVVALLAGLLLFKIMLLGQPLVQSDSAQSREPSEHAIVLQPDDHGVPHMR